MNRDELRRLDLNLLLAFDVLIEEESVTRAAERMQVGQPAMSAWLSKLRRFFDDPLLVRQGRGLVATTRARALAGPIRDALDRAELAVRTSRSFDPSASNRTFAIMASDYVLLLLLGPLLAHLRTLAPHINFKIIPTRPSPVPYLTHGRVDIVIFPDELIGDTDDIVGIPLFRDRLVCAVSRDNPHVGTNLTLEQFRELPWISYDADPIDTITGARMREKGYTRPIEVLTQSFVVQPMLLPGTEFMALIPERLGLSLSENLELRLLDPPIEFAELREAMYWPAHADSDPGHRWLREQVLTAAKQMERDS